MKKIFILFLLLVANGKSFAQGTDVIFMIDNSNSIVPGEYNQIKNCVSALATKILSCNPLNKITVIQYCGDANPKIWIESDFTNTVFTYIRRTSTLGSSAYAHESVGLIGNALDHIASPNIYGTPQLNRTPGNALAIYLFTDDGRVNLVNRSSSGIGTNDAFQNYTDFKVNRDATFFVSLVPESLHNAADRLLAKKAAAAIASGSCIAGYQNEIESYPLDPDGPGQTPRFLVYRTEFYLTESDVNMISEQLCAVQYAPCDEHITLTSPTNDVPALRQDNRQASIAITASNVIEEGAVGLYHAGNSVILLPGFNAKVFSRFRAYIEGCNDKFICQIEDGNPVNRKVNSVGTTGSIILYPNPANQKVTIEHDLIIKNIQIMSTDGKIILTKDIGANLYEINISNYMKGIYIVIVQTGDGRMFTSKLVKN